MHSLGYRSVSQGGVEKLEHVCVAERALGKPLPEGAIVHHVDGDRSRNIGGNLVVCPNRAYHNLIHMRERALDACGHASWRKCVHCGQYDDPINLVFYHKQQPRHAGCRPGAQRR